MNLKIPKIQDQVLKSTSILTMYVNCSIAVMVHGSTALLSLSLSLSHSFDPSICWCILNGVTRPSPQRHDGFGFVCELFRRNCGVRGTFSTVNCPQLSPSLSLSLSLSLSSHQIEQRKKFQEFKTCDICQLSNSQKKSEAAMPIRT